VDARVIAKRILNRIDCFCVTTVGPRLRSVRPVIAATVTAGRRVRELLGLSLTVRPTTGTRLRIEDGNSMPKGRLGIVNGSVRSRSQEGHPMPGPRFVNGE